MTLFPNKISPSVKKNILHVIPICCGKYVHFQFPFTNYFRYNFIVYNYAYKAVRCVLGE